ncbi:MAG TPA: hypothetical protein VFQ68_06215 [Streptosporangiaceae bacterium]|nr:hypothetical protein [Streptosporangiaceae bacterium]
MPLALTGSLAVAGLLAGWPQRAAITRLAIPASPPAPDEQVPKARTVPPALVPGCVTAILLGALAARVPGGAGSGGLVLAAACWLAVCAVPLIFTDLAVSRLPDPLTATAYAGTAVVLLLAAAFTTPGATGTDGHGASWGALARAVLGGLALAGCYLLLMIISPSGMSLGDLLTELRRRSHQLAEVSIAAAGQKLQAMDQLAARHQVTHLGMPDFRPSTGRTSGAAGGP